MNGTSFKNDPHKIHNEFAGILRDLVTNIPAKRNQVPWRQNAPKQYLKKAMKNQSRQPNSEEHTIEGELNEISVKF